MQLVTSLLAIGGLATSVVARNPAKSVGKKFDLPRPQLPRSSQNIQHVKRQYTTVNETTPLITAPGAKSMYFKMVVEINTNEQQSSLSTALQALSQTSISILANRTLVFFLVSPLYIWSESTLT